MSDVQMILYQYILVSLTVCATWYEARRPYLIYESDNNHSFTQNARKKDKKGAHG